MNRVLIFDFEHNTMREVWTPDGYEICPACEGHGKVEDDFYGNEGETITCQDCEGSGLLRMLS